MVVYVTMCGCGCVSVSVCEWDAVQEIGGLVCGQPGRADPPHSPQHRCWGAGGGLSLCAL